MHNVDVFSVQRLGNNCFVALHDDPVLQCEFMSVREEETNSRLELVCSGGPSSLNNCTEGLQDLILCYVLSEFFQMGCRDVSHLYGF